MKMKLFQGTLKTAGKTADEIREKAAKENWFGEITDQDIENNVKYNDLMDGIKGLFSVSQHDENLYTMLFWFNDDDAKMKEAVYIMEQDSLMGTYINDREQFDADWQSGEYDPPGIMCFKKDEVEITGEVTEENV